MSSRSQVESREQPFQVVTQKRSSAQGRRGFGRDKGPSSRSQGLEESNSTASSSARKRQAPGQQLHSAREAKQGQPRSNHTEQVKGPPRDQERDKEREREREGGSSGLHGHPHRHHSWDSEMSSSTRTTEKIERAQSARFDRLTSSSSAGTTETSNRFERLNPDTEAPGDSKPGSSRGRKRAPRNNSGPASYRSRSPKRKSAREGKEAREQRDSVEKKEGGAGLVEGGELEWDAPLAHSLQQESPSMADSPREEVEFTVSFSGSESAELDDQDGGDKMSGASAKGDSTVVAPGNAADVASSSDRGEEAASGDVEQSSTLDSSHIFYTREELLALRFVPLSQKKPDALKEEFFRGGKWCAEAWLTPQTPPEEREELEEIPAVEGKSIPKLKNPSTLSIIREHDPKSYGKVCLSPQRRSFGSGCSWKDMSSSGSAAGSGKETQTSTTSPSTFEAGDTRRSSGSRSGLHAPYHHTPRVINHIPLRDQKGWKEGEDRERPYGGYKGRQIQEEVEEPEWMAFGPSDRSEVIELVGMEEHERGRAKDKEQEREEVEEEEEVEEMARLREEEEEKEGRRVEDGKKEGGGEEMSPHTSEGSVGVEEGRVEVRRVREEHKALEPENEFMLDGFDFSTSVSICHALASDEEEEEEERVERTIPLPTSVANPNELSSALMKALRVGENRKGVQSSGRPVNALTLDEIHERENIHTHPTSHSDMDQSAYNRFVADLQSSGAIQEEQNIPQPHLPQKLPRPPVPLAMPRKYHDPGLPMGRGTGRGGPGVGERGVLGLDSGGGNSFGYLLEKELEFDEEYVPPSHLSRLHPYHNSMGQTREPPLTKMDPSTLLREGYGHPLHGKSLFHTPHPPTHQIPPHLSSPSALPGRPVPTLHEKWPDRSWVYPEAPSVDYGGHRQPPVDPLGPQMHHSASSGRPMSMTGRPPPNNWAIEMERRRVMELQQMRERDMRERERMMAVAGGVSSHQQMYSSKPNISLLPTAVMRQLHNSNPNHSLTDIARSSHSSSTDIGRLEQDFPSRPVYTHSSALGYPEGLGMMAHSRDYPSYPAAHMRLPPQPVPGGGDLGIYGPPPQYIPMPHGMPSQQNPYMH